MIDETSLAERRDGTGDHGNGEINGASSIHRRSRRVVRAAQILLAFASVLIVGLAPRSGYTQSAGNTEVSREDLSRAQKKRFTRLVEEGKEAFENREFEDALPKFERAFEIYPADGLLYRMAQCHDRIGNTKEAVTYYERFLERRPETSRRDEIEKTVARLENDRKVSVSIESEPPGARVYTETEEDGERRTLGQTPLETKLRPGKTQVTLEKDGFGARTETIEPMRSEKNEYRWELSRNEVAKKGSGVVADRSSTGPRFPVLPAMVGGVGLATYGTLFGIGTHCRSKPDPCDPGLYRPVAIGSYAGAGLAVAGFGTAAVLWLVRRSNQREATRGGASVSVEVRFGPSRAHIGMSGRF